VAFLSQGQGIGTRRTEAADQWTLQPIADCFLRAFKFAFEFAGLQAVSLPCSNSHFGDFTGFGLRGSVLEAVWLGRDRRGFKSNGYDPTRFEAAQHERY
jgi:hypothetical protein